MGFETYFLKFILNLILIKNVFNYAIYEHSEILSLKENYKISLISHLSTNSNIIEIANKTFYYFNKTQPDIENIIKNNCPILYFENKNEFIDSIKLIQSLSNNISGIIINNNDSYNIDDLIKNNNENLYIFLYNDIYYNNIIKEKYSFFSLNNTCSIKISILFKSDIASEKISIFLVIFFSLILLSWIYIYKKAKDKNQKLFIHSTILLILILYLIHSILFIIWIYNFNYNDIERNYSIWSLPFFLLRFFSFFIKIIIAFSLCLQLNIIELKEHYDIIKESKSPLIHMIFLFFALSFEYDETNIKNKNIFTYELFNMLYYLFVDCIFIFRYSKIKKIIYQRIIDSYPERGLDIPSLIIKKNLLIKHSYMIILSNIIIYLFYLIIAFSLYQYKNMKISVLLLHHYDIVFMIGIIVVYFPKKLPMYYIEYSFLEGFSCFKNKNNKNAIIYNKKNYYNYNYDEEEYLLSKNEYDLFLVENPFYDDIQNIGEKDNNGNLINNNDLKDIYNNGGIGNLTKLKIGYKDNELEDKMYIELKSILSSMNKK